MIKKRNQFSTTIEEDILNRFKEKCKEDNININDALELLMETYITGKVEFRREVVIK